MAHNIYNSKFQSFRVPAWHKLGLVLDTPFTAPQAADSLGIPDIHTEDVVTASGVPVTGYKAIIGTDQGTASPGGAASRKATVYSVVSNDYKEITHRDFVNAYDEATEHTCIETIGLLGRGETLFVSAKLPTFQVKGDECDNYLLAYNPLTGKDASTARITPVRVVCANTLAQSAANYKDQFRVIHTSDAAKDIKAWLGRVWNLATAQSQTVQEAFEILAGKPVNDSQLKTVLESVYPIVGQTEFTDEFVAYVNRIQAHRQSVLELFQGAAVGQTSAFVGTAWGAWNSVVEYEDYAKSRRQASSILVGAGAMRKDLAFRQLIAL